MERSVPEPHGHQRRQGRTCHHHHSSTCAQSPEPIHSNNLPKNCKPLNPNINNRISQNKHTYNTNASNQAEYDRDESLPIIVGTCPFMCPVEERKRRERLRDLAVFERLYGNPGKTSSNLAVKMFCRTISTKHVQASHVRPLPVLECTLNYLFDLLSSSLHSFQVVYEFIFDRTRSIRQDLSMQNIISDQAVSMYERLVKFHILSLHKFRRCIHGSNISPMHHLNMEQLSKTLASLYNLYESNRISHPIFENEAEYRSFYVLLNLGLDSLPPGESLSLWFRNIPSPILKSKQMCFSRRVLRHFRLGNFKRFISTTEAEATNLQYCIIEPYIDEVRALAVSSINQGGYKLHPYPLADLSKLLFMKEIDMESFCNDCGLKITTDEDGRMFLPTKQASFAYPQRGSQNYYLLDSERLAREFGQGSVFKWL